jgi:hypothetical protein
MATAQKDNTHIFENETATLLSEAYGQKIIQWANSGEGYTPVVRKEEEEPVEDIVTIKKEIIDLCKTLGGTANETLMATLKEYASNGNPNSIKSIDKAKDCLAAIKALN